MDHNRYEIHSIPSLVPDSAPPSSGLTPYRILSIASFVSYLYSSLTTLSDLACADNNCFTSAAEHTFSENAYIGTIGSTYRR